MGTPVTTDEPKFTGADGNETTPPKGTTYKIGDGAPEGATVDEETGKVTYTPKDTDAGNTVEIPVVVTYPDKNTDNTTDNTKVNIDVAEVTPEKVIPYLPGEEEPTTDSDGKVIPKDYVTVTFKAEEAKESTPQNPVYKGKIKVGDKTGEVVKAKVKPGTNLEGMAETIPAEGYGFTVWNPALGEAAEGNEYTAHFMKSGDEAIEPIPEDWCKVTLKQDDDSIAAKTVEEKVYAVAPGDKLAAAKFPKLTDAVAKEGYEKPGWYKDNDTEATKDPTAVEKEAGKYTPTADPVEKDKGTAVTEKDVTDAVKVPDYKENPKYPGQKPKVTVDEPSKLPDGNTPGKTDVAVTVTYPDGSTDKLTVPVTINDTTKPSDNGTSVDTSGKHPVDPTNDKQGTGVVVNNPDGDTKITAKDEDGKDIPVVINPNTGEVEVTPGTNVDGPIVVTIIDPDLPDGSTTVIVDVNGHKIFRDDNGNGYPGDNGHIYDHDHNHRWVFPVVPNYSGVTINNVQPYENTLWYIFTIDSYKYQEVRNKVATDYTMDVTPVIRNNRTMLPLRYVAEALGADVEWDNSTRTARFTKGGLTASIQIDGNEIVLSNGQTVKMDSKPLNINSRILVPVVNVANVFGLTNGNTLDGIDQDIEWDAQTRTATIYIKR